MTNAADSSTQAAGAPAALAALALSLAALRRSRMEPGDHVAVVGLSPMGLAAVRVAKHLGAARIDAIDADADLRKAAASLGATATHAPAHYAQWAKADGITELPRRLLVFTPAPGSLELAIIAAGRRAVIVVVADAAPGQATIPDYYLNMIMKEAAIIGLKTPSAAEHEEAGALTRTGWTR